MNVETRPTATPLSPADPPPPPSSASNRNLPPNSNSESQIQASNSTPRVSLSITRPDRRSQNASSSSNTRVSREFSTKKHHARSSSLHRNANGQTETEVETRIGREKGRGGGGGGAARRSLSIMRRRSESVGGPVDPMQEPRRSIGKRPHEFGLAEKDPHKASDQAWWKHHRRAVPFAAPYPRSGIVLDRPATLKDWKVPGPLTFGHGQWWYLIVAQGFVACVISGAINFGVATAMYRSAPSINLWTFSRSTVAGDMGVTVIIQQIVSFIITSSLVHHDLAAGPIGPLRRPWPPLMHLPSTPEPGGHALGFKMPVEVKESGVACPMGRSEGKSKRNAWFWWIVRSVMMGSERNDILASGISWRQRLERLVWTAAQGFMLCCLTFWWYWPISIAIVSPIYEHRELAGTWVPMIIKLIYGGLLSLLTNPIMALMAMGAESSVRRCYPELPIWHPYGGQADFALWKLEQGIVGSTVNSESGQEESQGDEGEGRGVVGDVVSSESSSSQTGKVVDGPKTDARGEAIEASSSIESAWNGNVPRRSSSLKSFQLQTSENQHYHQGGGGGSGGGKPPTHRLLAGSHPMTRRITEEPAACQPEFGQNPSRISERNEEEDVYHDHQDGRARRSEAPSESFRKRGETTGTEEVEGGNPTVINESKVAKVKSISHKPSLSITESNEGTLYGTAENQELGGGGEPVENLENEVDEQLAEEFVDARSQAHSNV